MPKKRQNPLYQRIRQILDSARAGVARSVNTTQVVANWLIGREIVEEEQNGKHRADYGKQVIEELSQRLISDYGSGYSVQNLWLIRRFYLNYPRLVSPAKIPHALRGESSSHNKLTDTGFLYAPRRESWKPGQLNPNFSWTHYRILLRVDKPQAQAFYEIEAIKDTWSARELERQKNSLLYERLALSRDKKGFITLRDPSCCVGIVENKYGKDSALQNAGK